MYLQQNNHYQPSNQISIDLEDKDLWSQFESITNEMILTKTGRRTFPLVKIRLNGLEESALYTVQVEFRVSDQFKYRFVNGEWRATQRTEKISSVPVIYEHADSPNFGHHWTKDSIPFTKLKLTNNEHTKSKDNVFLRSLNKYDPIIHIYRHDRKNVDDKMLIFSHFFKETQFIAVTAYQNEQITNLKIKFNPFAKAFLNNKAPIITIKNNSVISTSASAIKKVTSNNETKPAYPSKTQYSIENISQTNTIKSEPIQQSFASNQHQSTTHNQQAYNNNIFPNNSSSYAIQNWYASRYSIDQTNQQPLYPAQNQIGQQYQNDTYNNNQNIYEFDYAASHHLNNQYLYQQRFYNPLPYYQPQLNSEQQPQGSCYQYQPYLNSTTYESSYSPADYYNKSNNTSSAKRTSMKDNRHAPYNTTRPSVRRASNNSSNNTSLNDNLRIPISPVYNTPDNLTNSNNSSNNYDTNNIISKLEFNENNSDDSINSTELFLNQLNARNMPINTQSSVSSVSSSYSAVSKATNESGYYTHSPTSIALILDSANNQQDTSV